MKKTKKKRIPKFRNEDQEREFWATHSALDYLDISTARRVTFPNLKPSVRTISIRLPEMMLEELKLLANKRDVPYQSLLKMFWPREFKRNWRTQQKPENYLDMTGLTCKF